MDYKVVQDIQSVIELTGSSIRDFADDLGVSRVSVSKWLNGATAMSERCMQDFYSYAYSKGIRLNKIKEQLYREDVVKDGNILLFHGSKDRIEGELRIDCNKKINDFGNGFYCGESLEQSAMFVSSIKNSSLYMLLFNPSNLKCKHYSVDREWMLTIAYYRKRLEEYKDNHIVKQIPEAVENADYIVAPIADNRMYEIIDSFIEGEITDVQCQHCLSATNLGMQYVFVSEKALSNITLLERCFLTEMEKEAYLSEKNENYLVNMDKVKLARKQYRNQGEYIEDILK